MKKQVKKKQKADATLYCVCRQTYEDERFMIQCNVCSDWFHGDCVGISEKQVKTCFNEDSQYFYLRMAENIRR